jgi:hypothetical protein
MLSPVIDAIAAAGKSSASSSFILHTKHNQIKSFYNAGIPILCQNWGILVKERIGK